MQRELRHAPASISLAANSRHKELSLSVHRVQQLDLYTRHIAIYQACFQACFPPCIQ